MGALLALGHRMRQRLPDDDLDYSLLPMLRMLYQSEPVRHSALAEGLSLDASTVSRKVRHLEERRLVRVTHDQHDGRARQVELLPAGLRALERLLDQRREIIGSVLAGWTAEDREQLRALLVRFNHDLDDPTPTELQENPA